MDREEHIQFWIESSDSDFQALEILFANGANVHALFFCHLALEKICKAIWIKFNNALQPPRIHNLLYLIDQTPLELSEADRVFLEKMNSFQMEGRYPDYRNLIHKLYNSATTGEIILEVKRIREWLLKKV